MKIRNLITIKELNIEITPLIEWTKPYNQIQIPKGFRLIKLSELLYIWEIKAYRNHFFKEYLADPKWMAIACKQLWNDEERKRSRWFCLYRNLDLDLDDGNLQCSLAIGRVVFARDLNKRVKKDE